MRRALLSLSLGMALLFLTSGCEKKSPARDQIPLLRARLLELQNAVKDNSPAAIDSLMSVKIIAKKQGSDSLLSLVYGPDRDRAFERFGNYSIVYTSDKARIECFIMDSTVRMDRPIVLFLAHEHGMWLFTSFEVGVGEADTLSSTSP